MMCASHACCARVRGSGHAREQRLEGGAQRGLVGGEEVELGRRREVRLGGAEGRLPVAASAEPVCLRDARGHRGVGGGGGGGEGGGGGGRGVGGGGRREGEGPDLAAQRRGDALAPQH